MMRTFVAALLLSLSVSACDDGPAPPIDGGADADADDGTDADADGPDADGGDEPDAGAGPTRLFSVAIFTDIHIGEGYPDYGTPGFDDEGGDEYEITERIRATVARVNDAVDEMDVAFAVILGDLTDSGERSELVRGREILDDLDVPYFPLIGNHDMWPYTADTIADAPTGDVGFEEVWLEHLETTGAGFEDFRRAPTPVDNPEIDGESRFQNYAFTFLGVRFLALDLGTRQPAPEGAPGVDSEIDLHDFEGGTWPWLEAELARDDEPEPDHLVVLLHHVPTITIPGYDGLTPEEDAALAEVFGRPNRAQRVVGFFCGHHHMTYELPASSGQPVVVTAAAKETGAVRFLQFFDDGSVDWSVIREE